MINNPVHQKLPSRLIVALDLPLAQVGAELAEKLHGHVGMFKVGLESYTAEGPVLVRYLLAQGERIFLDLKFHDIPNTVAGAAREATLKGVSMFSVHAAGGSAMIKAAVKASRDASTQIAEPRPLVLAVTVLTSLDENAIRWRNPGKWFWGSQKWRRGLGLMVLLLRQMKFILFAVPVERILLLLPLESVPRVLHSETSPALLLRKLL